MRSTAGADFEQRASSAVRTDDCSAFDRLRGGAVLSQWRPTGYGETMPDIPAFLRRLPLSFDVSDEGAMEPAA
jgi:hypothetical protein